MKDIDALPHGPNWQRVEHVAFGQTHELWMRDPVDCVAELIGNPLFSSALRYRPEQLFVYDAEGTRQRVYDEMWTGEWWWDVQVSPSLMPIFPVASLRSLDNSCYP
jgi:hypothetical protein